jgi:hypothetical protein
MKAGAVIPPQDFNGVIIPENSQVQQIPDTEIIENNEVLQDLGFEEGELEMFSEMANGLVDEQALIDKYLEVAQAEPYNLNWTTVEEARNADYDTGVQKPNGTTYTKHDIANDTLNVFYDNIGEYGGKGSRKHKQRRTRKNKKSKKNKKSRKVRRKSRKH